VPQAAKPSNPRRDVEGYVLLTLLLLVSLLMIAAAVILPTITFEIRRDKEEELVHRGVQYSRAIRAYVKKTGRYPVRLEELQQAGGLKFLRKMYKDPITGEDFKLLHQADIMGITNKIPNLNGANSGFGDNTQPASDNTDSGDNAGNLNTEPNAQTAVQKAQNAPQAGNPPRLSSIGTMNTGAPQGMLIFGVASKSKRQSIREFDHKNHYSDWLFFYDPKYDRGLEIKGPTSLTPVAVGQVGTPVQSLTGQPPGTSGPNPPQTPSASQPAEQQQ